MRAGIIVAFSLVAGLALADDAPPPHWQVESRQAAVAVGYGNDTSGIGVSAEKYFAQGRLSFFGGVGYVPSSSGGRGASGMGVAGGLRAYTRGHKHRAFAELAFSPVAVEVAPEGSGLSGQELIYGPSVSLGYNLVKRSGFTLVLSAGVGQGVTGPSHVHATEFLSNIALGYTWTRR